MKKKLSLLLASAVIATMIPVSSFAWNEIGGNDKSQPFEITAGKEDVQTYQFKLNTGFTELKSGEEIRLDLSKGAKFSEAPTVKVTKKAGSEEDGNTYFTVANSNNTATAKTKQVIPQDTEIKFTIKVKASDVAEGEDVKVTLSGAGLKQQDLTIGKVVAESSNELSINVKEDKQTVSYNGGFLSTFEIKGYKKDQPVTIKLVDDSLKFDGAQTTFKGITHTGEGQKNVLTIPKGTNLTNSTFFEVHPYVLGDRTTDLGEVEIEVTQGDKTATAVIGEIVDYGATATAKEPGKKEMPTINAGSTGKVQVTIESTKGTVLGDIDVTLDGAKVKASNNNTIPVTSNEGITSIKSDVKKDESTTEFTIVPDTAKTTYKFTIDKLDIDADAPVGNATMTISSRGMEDIKLDIAKIVRDYEVSTNVTEVKRGESVETSDIVIKLAKDNSLKDGQTVKVTFNGKIAPNEKATFEGTNGIQFGKVEWVENVNKDKVGFQAKVEKSSKGKEAEIVISDITTDMLFNAVHNRVYDVTVSIDGKDFATVDYAKCVAEYAIRKPQVVFTLGSADYTVNGTKKTLEAPVFTKDDRTMLPVGPLGLALGLDVSYNEATQTATFIDRDTNLIVTIKENADVLYMNGVAMPMTTSAITVNGRIFVPVSSVTQAFGLPIVWDAATSTVTIN